MISEEVVLDATGEEVLAGVTQLVLRGKNLTGFIKHTAVDLTQLEVKHIY